MTKPKSGWDKKGVSYRKWREGITKWKKNNPEKLRKYEEEYKEKYPEKVWARKMLAHAIETGKMKRQFCEICGEIAEAHHTDYSNPLDVRWFCPVHHTIIHINKLL